MSHLRSKSPILAAAFIALLLWGPNTVQHLINPDRPANAYAYLATFFLMGSIFLPRCSSRLPGAVRELLDRPSLTRNGTPHTALVLAVALGFIAQPAWEASVASAKGTFLLGCILSAVVSSCTASSLMLLLMATKPGTEQEQSGNQAPSAQPFPLGSLFLCGLLAWNLFTRIVPTEALFTSHVASATLIAIPPITLLALALFTRRARAPLPFDASGTAMPSPPQEALADFSEFNLTEREAQAILYLLQGKTSQESAQLSGIKASTVREYLRRAYKKIGVADADELRARYQRAPETTGTNAEESASPPKTISSLDRSLLLASSLLAVLPVGAPHGIWGVGQAHLYALGIGVLIASFLARSGCATRENRRLRSILSISEGTVPLAACWMLLTSSFALHAAALSFACSAIIGFFLCRWWQSTLRGRGWGQSAQHSIMCAGCLFSFVTLLPDELALLVGAGIFSLASLRFAPSPRRAEPGDQLNDSAPDHTGAHAILLGIIIGCSLEEVWRGLYWFSFMPAAMTFFVPLGLCCAYVLLASKGSARVPAFVLLLSLPAFLLINWDSAPTLVAAHVLLLLVMSSQGASPIRTHAIQILQGIAIGLVFGCLLFNKVATIFTYHVTILGVYGTQTGFELATVFLSALLFFASGAYFGRCIIRHNRELQTARQQEELAREDTLVREILLAYDLTPIQIETAVLLLQGRTLNQVCKELHYAPSTIKTARGVCLSRLGVTSTDALREAILAGLRRSQQDCQQ